MATQPSVITAPSAPVHQTPFEMIGEVLNAPEPSQAGSETPTEAAPETAAEPEIQSQPEVAEPDQQAETPAEATAVEPTTTEETNPYEQPEEESDFKPQTLTEILKTPDGKKMYANHKALREITKAIGHAPTVEQAKQYYGAFRDQKLMNEDIGSGNAQGAERLITHLFNPQRGEGVQIAAAQFAPTLAKTNPDAYAAAATPFLSNYGNGLWDRFNEMPDPPKWEGSLKQVIYNAAQAVHKDLTGKYRELGNGAVQPTHQTQQADPLAEQRAQLEAREARIRESEQQGQQRAAQQWEGAVNTKIRESLDAELDKALAKVKASYGTAPRVYNALKKEFHDVVRAGAAQNRAAWDIFQANLAAAKRSGSPEAIESVAQEYIRLAQPVIIANRKKFIEEAGVSAVAVNDAKHAELRSIDSHKAPSNGGAPVKPATAGPLQRMPGESQSAFNLRLIRG